MRPGARLGPYEIVAPLGAGGMGEVWRARDTRLGREVAIKVLPAEVARDADRVARFEREARALASLSHPVILAIHDFGREGDVAYAVTELLDGETVGDRLRRERLPWRRAVEIGAAVADGLAAAHDQGIVHRDLKPENLFLTSDGRVKVLDFVSPQLYTAVAYSNQGDYAQADAILRRVNESRERLSPLQRHMLDWHRARLAGRDTEALQAIRRAQQLVPRSSTVNYIVALECLDLNLPQQAVDNLAKLAPEAIRDSNSITGSWRYNVLTQAHHMLSNYERELAVADEAIQTFPDLLTVRSARVRALVALGRLDEVNRVVDEVLAVQSRAGTPGGLMVQAALELRAHGHREEALQMAARAVDWLLSRPPSERAREEYRPALAEALYAGEKWDEARAVYEALAATHPVAGGAARQSEARGAQQDPAESLRLSRAVDSLGSLGTLAARRGDRGEAHRVSDELGRIEGPFLFGRPTYRRACVAALLGEKQQAVDLLRESFAQGNSYDVGLHRDMDLEPLRDYPPFVELLRPKG